MRSSGWWVVAALWLCASAHAQYAPVTTYAAPYYSPTPSAAAWLAPPQPLSIAQADASVATGADRGLLHAGVALWVTTYVASAVGFSTWSFIRALLNVPDTTQFLAWSWVPVLGPFVQLAYAQSGIDADEALLVISGLAQLGGLALVIAGACANVPVEQALGQGVRFSVIPMASPTGGGIATSLRW